MKLRIAEFKIRLINGVHELIDTYFNGGSISDRLMNATVKIIVNQNIDKLDSTLELFANKDGIVDTDVIICEYTKAFGADKLIIDIRDFVNNDMIKGILPNKALAIKIDDISNILNKYTSESF